MASFLAWWGGIPKEGKWALGIGAVVSALTIAWALVPSGDGGEEPYDAAPAVSRDGKWIAFSSNRAPGEGIYVARRGADAKRITDPGKDSDDAPDWSPDGSRLAFFRFSDHDTSRVYVVNRDGSGLRQLTTGNDSDPAWSPDGKTIAFARRSGDLGLDFSTHVIEADGTNERLLLRDADAPAWSPDGSKIAYERNAGDGIAIFDLKTRRSKRLADTKDFAFDPAWSRDGKRVAFESHDDVPSDTPYVIGIPEIYVVNADGTGQRRLTHDEEDDWTPTWTPAGRIVFASFRDGPLRLYVMNRDGSGVRGFE